MRYINDRARKYHELVNSTAYLLLVTWGVRGVQSLMTVQAYEQFRLHINVADRATCFVTEITPESAIRLGFGFPIVAEDICRLFGDRV